jgi:hypothetical protein
MRLHTRPSNALSPRRLRAGVEGLGYSYFHTSAYFPTKTRRLPGYRKIPNERKLRLHGGMFPLRSPNAALLLRCSHLPELREQAGGRPRLSAIADRNSRKRVRADLHRGQNSSASPNVSGIGFAGRKPGSIALARVTNPLEVLCGVKYNCRHGTGYRPRP